MKRILSASLACLTLLLAGAGLMAQNAVPDSKTKTDWISSNGIPIRSGDPADADFSDLMALKEKIGNARVVLLGEQSHGDGTTFLMKCRLVRFLHEVMGFDVLAWESGLYDCHKMEEALHQDIPRLDAILKGIFGIWGMSRQVQPVFEYARSTYATQHPLEMAGFDCQFSGSAGKNFTDDALAFFKSAGDALLTEKEVKLLSSSLDMKTVMKLPEAEKNEYKNFVAGLAGLVDKNMAVLEKKHNPREISFWKRNFVNYHHLYVMMDIYLSGKPFKATDNNVRDQAMGDTLAWLADDYYKGKKIIVWAASFHNMWRGAEIDTGNPQLDYKSLKTMGDTVLEKLGDDAYSITFTAYQGKAGMANRPKPEPFDVSPAEAGSLEDAFHATGQKFMFLDFRGLRKDPDNWLKKGIVARPLGYGPMKTDWTKHFDAVVFTDTMEPSVRVEGAPAPAPKSNN